MTNADAQQPATGGSVTSGPNDIPPGASGNFNLGQSGGNNYQLYINQAPQKLKFTAALGAQLLARIPKDKPMTIDCVGSKSDLTVADQIISFLVQNGYDARPGSLTTGIINPAPERPLTWDVATSTLTVAPNVH